LTVLKSLRPYDIARYTPRTVLKTVILLFKSQEFDGHRVYGFSQLNSSEEVEKEMEKYGRLESKIH